MALEVLIINALLIIANTWRRGGIIGNAQSSKINFLSSFESTPNVIRKLCRRKSSLIARKFSTHDSKRVWSLKWQKFGIIFGSESLALPHPGAFQSKSIDSDSKTASKALDIKNMAFNKNFVIAKIKNFETQRKNEFQKNSESML